MDSAGADLQQLCLAVKSNTDINHKIQEWLTDTDVPADFCQCKASFESDFRTSLQCLLNSYHATEISVERFLVQQISNLERLYNDDGDVVMDANPQNTSYERKKKAIFSLHGQDLNGITALHVATYRNSLHADKIAGFLLNWDRLSNEFLNSDKAAKKMSLASIPMKCGSYPLHILTGQNLTIKEELLETLLRADPSIPFKDDVNGDNPISLLWKNTLRFRWAISVMQGAAFIDYIKNDDCSWMAIITPHKFIQFSLRMAGAALQQQNPSQNNCQSSVNTIHDICRIPRCPPMLLRLLQSPEYKAQFGIRGNAYTMDEQGMLPIHHAVQAAPVSYSFVPSFLTSQCKKSLVEILLEENPDSVKIADRKGRLPLHYALDAGCVSEMDLLALIQLHPESLRIEDPKNGLLPFMLVSTNRTRVAICNTLRDPDFEIEQKDPSSAYEKYAKLEGEKICTGGNYQAEWKRDHVRMTYLLLMLCPDAIASSK